MKLRNKKTGEIDEFLFEVISDRIDLYRRVATSETEGIWHYNSIAEFNEEWEDYKPAEPLIKDEKVRKAVRAWARENLIEKVGFKLDRGKTQCACYFYDESCKVCEFGLKFYLDIEHDKVYTIAELCGEVEE